jgi:hypothetical protein
MRGTFNTQSEAMQTALEYAQLLRESMLVVGHRTWYEVLPYSEYRGSTYNTTLFEYWPSMEKEQ